MRAPAAHAVLERLRSFACRLGACDPTEDLGDLIARSFPLPLSDPRYQANALSPGALAVEHSYCQLEPRRLRLDFEPFALPAAERAGAVLTLMRRLLPQSIDALDARAAAWDVPAPPRFGAFVGAAYDRDGLCEVKLYREIDGHLPPGPRARLRGLAVVIPSIEPLMHSIAAGRDGVAERLYVRCRQGLRVLDLARMDTSVADRIPALAHVVATLTGGRLFLPPDGAIIGIRELDDGCELKLELLPASLSLSPVRQQTLVERVLAGDAGDFRRWLVAAGEAAPPSIDVVSVRVAPRLAPALNVYVRPFAACAERTNAATV